ncbi:12682_t:CDS:2 [Cetraspora pellucida]|uniref:12682_t:CDS:1 n=1 Tax=Cetraspora pellucida TaxID=1433469 RepID=A0A9N9N1A5_9GLOM|nr:12682_t:CDS:2 [Cetraspora pellucida]
MCLNIFKCWHNSNKRPTVQHIFNDLNNINFNEILIISDEKTFTECNKNEIKDQPMSEMERLNSTEFSNYYTNLRNNTAKELMLISSIIKILSENSMINDQNNLLNLTSSLSTLNIVETISISLVNAIGSVICCLKKHIVEHNKNSEDILEHYNNYKFKYYFTSIIGFFYEYGIGTIVDYHKAFDMYRQATENFNTSTKIYGKYYIGQCYDNGYSVIKSLSNSLNWYLKSAEKGNASGQNAAGHSLMLGDGTNIDEEEGLKCGFWIDIFPYLTDNEGYNSFCHHFHIILSTFNAIVSRLEKYSVFKSEVFNATPVWKQIAIVLWYLINRADV